ncbi:MAG: cupredoxin domain-containing protein [Chloroflexi bacterium]|nr:cupredoxin domain-containing protein [Chloroflexota bacterium]MBP8056023.1 cupredoxin domain-containing protein [Chloroflexota bacterium]
MKKLIFGLLVMSVVLITACSQSGEADEVAILPTAEFTVVATDIVYDTANLEVVAGQPVKVTFRNNGALVHDFSIAAMPLDGEALTTETDEDKGGHAHDMEEMAAELDVHVAAPMNGGSNVLQFTPAEPGTYEYYCTVEGHKEAGMVGQLVVSAP